MNPEAVAVLSARPRVARCRAMTPDIASIAQTWLRGTLAKDDSIVDTVVDPDIKVWHNTDKVEQTLTQNRKVAAWLHSKVPDLDMVDIRQNVFDGGWVQQHRMVGTRSDGSALEILSCIVFTVSPEGRITRMEEYIDPSQVGKL